MPVPALTLESNGGIYPGNAVPSGFPAFRTGRMRRLKPGLARLPERHSWLAGHLIELSWGQKTGYVPRGGLGHKSVQARGGCGRPDPTRTPRVSAPALVVGPDPRPRPPPARSRFQSPENAGGRRPIDPQYRGRGKVITTLCRPHCAVASVESFHQCFGFTHYLRQKL